MNDIVKPGAGLLFMKVKTNPQKRLSDIIVHKREEIRRTGFGMWAYGGNTCHPMSMVQPFGRTSAVRGHTIHLCIEQIVSDDYVEPLCAAEYSVDSLTWRKIPETIEVGGSHYALVFDELHEERFTLPLDQTRVSVGPNVGSLGSHYIRGQVDVACLKVFDALEPPNHADSRKVEINLVATLREPFAVFLRGQG